MSDECKDPGHRMVADIYGFLSAKVQNVFAAALEKDGEGDPVAANAYLRHAIAESLNLVIQGLTLPGSPVVPVLPYLRELVHASNRVVSFVYDGQTHFGSGMLVGPAHVLTAAHLFFDERGYLVDPQRLHRITVEAHTTLIGNLVAEGGTSTSPLYRPDTDDWVIDPGVRGGVAQRDVFDLDFAIVRLEKALGNDKAGFCKRGWFEIPTAEEAEILAPDLSLQVLEFLDRKELLTAIGVGRGVERNGFRLLHTASTASSASGAAILSSESRLIAMHLGSSFSGEVPASNRALPIRRVAEVIDASGGGGTTIRSLLR